MDTKIRKPVPELRRMLQYSIEAQDFLHQIMIDDLRPLSDRITAAVALATGANLPYDEEDEDA